MDKKKKIRAHIQSLLIKQGKSPDFSDDESLVLSGLLDSLAILEIVVFMEEEFGIDFSERGFDQNDDFDSLTSITAIE